MRKRIALWGYGYFGHDVETAVNECWKESYEITAIFDRRFSEFNKEPQRSLIVYDPQKVREYYERGLFDKVYITVFDEDERSRIKAELDAEKVPVLEDFAFNLFKRPEECAADAIIGDYSQRGYSFYAFKDQLLYFAPRASYPIIYDTDRTINSAFWKDYEIRQEVFPRFFRPPAFAEENRLEGEYCFLDYPYSKNYWHFTFELMDKVFIMERNGFGGKYIIPRTDFSEDLLGLIGVKGEKVIWTDSLRTARLWRIDKLICPMLKHSDRRNASRVLIEMANSITDKLKENGNAYPERLFVKRIGRRRLIISDSILKKHGFKTIIPEELSVKEQIRYFMNARIVFCPHGANTTNAIYMKPGSVLIESFSIGWLNPSCTQELIDKGIYYLPIFQQKDLPGGVDVSDDYIIRPEMLEAAMINALKLTCD